MEQIYIDDLECPHCDADTYTASWDIAVDQYNEKVTEVTCDTCGKIFYVHTRLTVESCAS